MFLRPLALVPVSLRSDSRSRRGGSRDRDRDRDTRDKNRDRDRGGRDRDRGGRGSDRDRDRDGSRDRDRAKDKSRRRSSRSRSRWARGEGLAWRPRLVSEGRFFLVCFGRGWRSPSTRDKGGGIGARRSCRCCALLSVGLVGVVCCHPWIIMSVLCVVTSIGGKEDDWVVGVYHPSTFTGGRGRVWCVSVPVGLRGVLLSHVRGGSVTCRWNIAFFSGVGNKRESTGME